MMTVKQTSSDPRLVAAYGFSEGTGTTTADVSGNGHTATLDSTSMWSSSGHTGNCISNISLSTVAQVPSAGWVPTVSLTIMAWVFRADWSQVNRRVVGIYAVNHTYDGIALAASRGSLPGPMVVVTTANNFELVLHPDQTVLTTGWHHLSATYDGASVQLYVDGTNTGSIAASGALSIDSAENWKLAGGGTGGVLDGRLDDVRFYNAALTGSEIAALMNVPVN
jgi:hypothetical protein